MHIKPLIASIFLLIFSHSVSGQSNTHTLDNNGNAGVKSRVNFVIKIPTKLSMTIHSKLLTSRSNTGNLYIGNSQTPKGSFFFSDKVITQQKTRPGSYIVASP